MESDANESSPSHKKQKTEIQDENDNGAAMDDGEHPEIEGDSGIDIDPVIDFDGDIHGKVRRTYLVTDLDNDECLRQIASFHYQWKKSEGFEVDWSQLTYAFSPKPVVWKEIMLWTDERSDKFIKRMTLFAIDKRNQEKGAKLELEKIMRANYYMSNGHVLFITFRAKDLSSSQPEPILYQTQLWDSGFEISIELFRPRPTDEEIASVEVRPPHPVYYREKSREFYLEAVAMFGPGATCYLDKGPAFFKEGNLMVKYVMNERCSDDFS